MLAAMGKIAKFLTSNGNTYDIIVVMCRSKLVQMKTSESMGPETWESKV
jgi:hypothetical protein